jgi:hypothetical protein
MQAAAPDRFNAFSGQGRPRSHVARKWACRVKAPTAGSPAMLLTVTRQNEPAEYPEDNSQPGNEGWPTAWPAGGGRWPAPRGDAGIPPR